MNKTADIVFDNLFAQLRNDAFGTNEETKPMSGWKWKQLEKYHQVATAEDVPYDNTVNYHLVNSIQEKKRERIFDGERHAIDTSVETLQLLNLIIYNIDCMNKSGLSLPGIVQIGRYLREQGHRVDYVKLDTWISKLFIKRMASLLSSVLLYIYNFESEELPFLYKKRPEVRKLIIDQLLSTVKTGIAQHNNTNTLKYSPLSSLGIAIQKARTSLDNLEE